MKNDMFSYAGTEYTFDEMKKLLDEYTEAMITDHRVSSIMKMVEGNTVLDVGCHAGVISKMLAASGKNVLGIDVLDSAITIAKTFNQVPGVTYKTCDLFTENFKDGQFDSILFLETIEHVTDPTRYLQEFRRILKPGGCLIISTPNSVSYINILYQFLIWSRNGQIQFIDSLKNEPRNTGTQLDHIFFWDFRTLLRYLIRNEFDYGDHKFCSAPPFTVRIKRFSLRILGKKEMRFLFPLLGPYLATLVVKVKKNERT